MESWFSFLRRILARSETARSVVIIIGIVVLAAAINWIEIKGIVQNTPPDTYRPVFNAILGLFFVGYLGVLLGRQIGKFLLNRPRDRESFIEPVRAGVRDPKPVNPGKLRNGEKGRSLDPTALVANWKELEVKLTARAEKFLAEELRDLAVEQLKTDLGKPAREAIFAKEVREALKVAKDRLADEKDALLRRGVYNLLAGGFTTVVALGVLSLVAFQVGVYKEGEVDWTHFLASILPRLTLAIFIQTFAFFFLRLYKSTLEEIKYYQNEITNIDCYTIGLLYSFEDIGVEARQKISSRMLEVDRNEKAATGKTEPGQVALDQDTQKKLLDIVKEVVIKSKES